MKNIHIIRAYIIITLVWLSVEKLWCAQPPDSFHESNSPQKIIIVDNNDKKPKTIISPLMRRLQSQMPHLNLDLDNLLSRSNNQSANPPEK